jgi:hypothetical protein
MAKIVVLLAVVILGYLFWQKLNSCPPKQRKKLLLRSGFFILIAVLLLLVATGRVHWIAVAITAALPAFKILFSLLLRALPFLQVWLKKRHAQSGHPAPPSNSQLTEEEAWQLLGLQPGASREDIIQSHKRLIQKLHPDRGGNDYLAAKLNAARDLLLGH